MCAEIELNGRVIETIGELVELVGKDNIAILTDIYPQPKEELLQGECCLCPVDMDATAQNAGYTSRMYDPDIDGDNWFMGYRWLKTG